MTRDRRKENARRLTHALESHAADLQTVERLAAILDYVPDQLREDIRSLAELIKDLNLWELPDLEDFAARI